MDTTDDTAMLVVVRLVDSVIAEIELRQLVRPRLARQLRAFHALRVPSRS